MGKPRIRSIKPEFATSGDMLRLSDSCALFFILLWPVCDDEGKHPFDLIGLAAKLGGRWHQGKVRLFVSCLVKSGQLRLNSDSTWLQVVTWFHQKIDKPKQPEVKASELQWLDKEASSKLLEESLRINARIGSDRIPIGSDQGSDIPSPQASPKPAPSAPEILTFDFESLYRKYPLKKGKAEGLARCAVQIKTQEDFDALSRAIDRYSADLKANGTSPQYTKHFSSFLGADKKRPWRDWLDADAGQTTLIPTGPTNRATQRAAGNQATLAAYKARLRGMNEPA